MDYVFTPWDIVVRGDEDRDESRVQTDPDAAPAQPRKGFRGWAARLIEALGGGREADEEGRPAAHRRHYQSDSDLC
ncbi:MAG: hypothetical protein ACKVVT_00140 [Dehalococcoidia bacterium]